MGEERDDFKSECREPPGWIQKSSLWLDFPAAPGNGVLQIRGRADLPSRSTYGARPLFRIALNVAWQLDFFFANSAVDASGGVDTHPRWGGRSQEINYTHSRTSGHRARRLHHPRN